MNLIRYYQRPLRTLAFYEGLLAAIAIAVCLYNGRLDFSSFGGTFATLGMLLVGYAVVSVFGSIVAPRNFQYQHTMSVNHSIHERVANEQRDVRSGFTFLANATIAGLGAVMVGFVMLFL